MKSKLKHGELITAVVVLFILIFLGTWFYTYVENWSWVDSFYFTVMTVTTVGFGDFVPTHDISKIMTSLYSMVSIPLVLLALGILARNYFEGRILHIENRMSEMLTREKKLEENVEEVIDDEKKPRNNG